jgi:glucokinase
MPERNHPILAIDVGGTKLAAAIMLPDYSLRHRHEMATLAWEGAPAILSRIITLARQVLATYQNTATSSLPVAAVGVASAGQIDSAQGKVVFATENLPGWTGLSLSEALSTPLGLPVFVENDVNCFALAEAALGAGRGYRHLLLVAMGTGVGGGVVVNGQIYSGASGRAGEVGHFCLEPVNGRPCTCGLSGCLEAYTATRIILEASGHESLQTLADAYKAGADIPAITEAATWLGWGLASLAHILGPEVIVIGGSVGLLGDRYMQTVQQAFTAKAMASYRQTPLLTTQLGPDSGLLGAGLEARQKVGTTN